MTSTIDPQVPVLEQGATILWPYERLVPDTDQPRQDKNWDIENTALNMLDLRERGLGLFGTGVLKAILVRLPPGALDKHGVVKPDISPLILGGEGRWRAVVRANEIQAGAIPQAPIVLQDVGAEESFEIAFFENAFATPMSPVDFALAMLKIKQRRGLTISELARRLRLPRDTVRSRLEAVTDADTLPLLEARPDALGIARRINQLPPGELRDEMIAYALQGASLHDVNDTLTARKQGLSLSRYRAERNVRALEKKHDQESAAAKSTGKTEPAGGGSSGGSAKNSQRERSGSSSSSHTPSASSQTLPTQTAHATQSESVQASLPVQPYIGDLLDTILRQLKDARLVWASSKMPESRLRESLDKVTTMRGECDEFIQWLQESLSTTDESSPAASQELAEV